MNEYQKDRFARRIISCLFNNLSNKRLAVLGFAFKKDTSDTRESPAITLVSNLVAEQAKVAIYDPKVKEEQIWKELVDYRGMEGTLKDNVEICSTAYAACEAADAVIIVTEWDEFSNRALADTQLVLQEFSPNRERARGTCLPTSPKPALKDLTKGTTSVRSFDTEAVDPTTSSGRLDWARVAQGMRKPRYVFDGRNMLDHTELEALGFRVEVIGKASKRPSPLQ